LANNGDFDASIAINDKHWFIATALPDEAVEHEL
jgi:hypothetical protein